MSEPCDDFARRGALALERGENDEHLAGCAECRAARDAYRATARRVAAAGDGWRAPAGWEARLEQTIARRAAARRRRVWLGAGSGGLAVAALVLAVVIRSSHPPQLATLALEVVVTLPPTAAPGAGPEPARRRSGSPRVGDWLVARARGVRRQHAELRVYRTGGDVTLRCAPPGGPSLCRRDGDGIEAGVALPRIGTYRVLLMASDRPLPPPSASLDVDAAAARRGGAAVILSDAIDVL
jgi:hypothetical protein